MLDLDYVKLGFKDVMIVPRPSEIKSRSEVDLIRKFTFENGVEWQGVPIVASNMTTIGTFEMAEALAKYKMLTCVHKHYPIYAWNHWTNSIDSNKDIINHVAVTSGISENDLDRLDTIMAIADFPFICLDVANGYMTRFIDVIAKVRERYPNKILIAGNVVEYRGAHLLAQAGVDIIKIGIGSGSVCTTRRMTGVGYPQISAIDECEKITIVGNRYIMSDGGCVVPGDLAKAFVAGADFVMLGGMLAAHNENETTEFYGMSSIKALKEYGEKKDYRVAEGKLVNLSPRGSVSKTLDEILGGLRSTGSYINCKTLDNFSQAKLIHVTEQTNDVFGT